MKIRAINCTGLLQRNTLKTSDKGADGAENVGIFQQHESIVVCERSEANQQLVDYGEN